MVLIKVYNTYLMKLMTWLYIEIKFWLLNQITHSIALTLLGLIRLVHGWMATSCQVSSLWCVINCWDYRLKEALSSTLSRSLRVYPFYLVPCLCFEVILLSVAPGVVSWENPHHLGDNLPQFVSSSSAMHCSGLSRSSNLETGSPMSCTLPFQGIASTVVPGA